MYRLIRLALLVLVMAGDIIAAELTITDDNSREIRLNGPAERIISLSPHITELLFAAGAGERIVGTVRFSDYPEQAETIPRVGDTYNLDTERIISLKPDIIILWHSGTRNMVIEEIEKTGFPIYYSEPRSLQSIAETILNFGRLAGTQPAAEERSSRFMERLSSLRSAYMHKRPVRVFYQFWHRPIFTVNDEHLINRVISLCSGVNVFADLSSLTPRVDRESVLQQNPEVIIASGENESRPPWLDEWRQWPELAAVRDGHVYFIPPDLLLRHTPRILDGAEKMCGFIERAR